METYHTMERFPASVSSFQSYTLQIKIFFQSMKKTRHEASWGFFLRKLITVIPPSPYTSKICTAPVTERGDSYFIIFTSLLLAYTQSSLKTASVLRAWSCYVFAWFHCCTKHVFLYIFVLRILAAGKELQVSFYLLLQAYNFFQLHLFLVLVINSEITFSVTKPQFLIL